MGDGYVNPNNRIVNLPEKPRKKTKFQLKLEKIFEDSLREVREKEEGKRTSEGT